MRVDQRQARAPGPSAIATATARLSSITGLGSSAAYSSAIRAQSVTGATCSRAIAACRPYWSGAAVGGERAALLDLVRVPQRAVLVGEQHEPPVGVDARVAARVVEQHQREQPARLARLGHQLDQQPAEPDRLGAQLAAHERRRRSIAA